MLPVPCLDPTPELARTRITLATRLPSPSTSRGHITLPWHSLSNRLHSATHALRLPESRVHPPGDLPPGRPTSLPNLQPSPSLPQTRQPGPDPGFLQTAPAPHPPGQAWLSRHPSLPSAGPNRLTRMRTQVPIVIVPAGDLRLKATGRSQFIGVLRQRQIAAHGAAGRELHTTAPAVCILERHPTTAILPSYRRTRWVRPPRQQQASPHVRGCRDSTIYIQVTGHARGRKFTIFFRKFKNI
jgi:hypothetical protein